MLLLRHRWDAVIGIVKEVALQLVTALAKDLVILHVRPIAKALVKVLVLANALLPININKNGKGYRKSKHYTPCYFPTLKIEQALCLIAP